MIVSIGEWLECVRRCRANRERPPVILVTDGTTTITVVVMDVFSPGTPFHVIVSVEGQWRRAGQHVDVARAVQSVLLDAEHVRMTAYAHRVIGAWLAELHAALSEGQGR